MRVASVLMALALAGPASGAVTFVQELGTASAKSSGTVLALTLGTTVPIGDTIIVSFAMNPNGGPVACADSGANAWTVDADVQLGSGIGGVRAVVCSSRLTAALAAGSSITVHHPNTTERGMSASVFAGLRANALDRMASGTGNDAHPVTPATATTSVAEELLVGTVGVEGSLGSDTFTPGAGFIALTRGGTSGGGEQGNITVNPEFRIVNQTGQYAAEGVLDDPRSWVAIITTYRSAGCGDGIVDPAEQCDGGDCCTPSCMFVTAGTTCRAAAGMCDLAETCTGSSSVCPVDAKSFAMCRAAAGPCDVAEACTGAGNDCPADAKSTLPCRPAASTCDVAESCDGVHDECPPDARTPAGTPCRTAAGVCDLAESCDGTSVACPADAKRTGVCRPSVGLCDVPESCDGGSNECPGDAVAPAGASCRAPVGACDVAESCDGVRATCPADGYLPAGSECRASTGACDRPETCTGSAPTCPADTGSPDVDLDGICDVRDVCPTIADPSQADRDGDGIGDACDPCSTLAAATPATKRLRIGRLNPPLGDETFRLGGTVIVPTTPEIDPVARGVRVLVVTGTGEVFLDVTIPGGRGWTSNHTRTQWHFRGASGGRVRKVDLRRRRAAPGTIRYALGGKGGFSPPAAGTTLVATFILDPPFASTGQCGDTLFASCQFGTSGKTFVCR